MVGYSYWSASQSEDVTKFVHEDLSRPLFEEYPFCGAWNTYDSATSALQGIDLPAYIAGTLLHSAITWQESCIDALMTPRGQLVAAAFVFPLWLLVGFSIRRIVQRRWHRCAEGALPRFLLMCGLIPLLFGFSDFRLPSSVCLVPILGLHLA
jgi:hypothetical protein